MKKPEIVVHAPVQKTRRLETLESGSYFRFTSGTRYPEDVVYQKIGGDTSNRGPHEVRIVCADGSTGVFYVPERCDVVVLRPTRMEFELK